MGSSVHGMFSTATAQACKKQLACPQERTELLEPADPFEITTKSASEPDQAAAANETCSKLETAQMVSLSVINAMQQQGLKTS